MPSVWYTDLSHGFDASDEADVDHKPGGAQTEYHPPLQRAADLNVWRDVQGFTVPEVVHRSAFLTLHVVGCIETP